MSVGEMLKQESEFHYRWIRKRVEQLEEMRREGRRYVEMPVEQVIQMLMETHALHQHIDRMQEHLSVGYNFGMAKSGIIPLSGVDTSPEDHQG